MQAQVQVTYVLQVMQTANYLTTYYTFRYVMLKCQNILVQYSPNNAVIKYSKRYCGNGLVHILKMVIHFSVQ